LGVATLLLTACQAPFGADNVPGSADEPSDSADPSEAPEAPTFDPAGGSFSSEVEVALSTATEGARIHYTTDGSTPDSASPEYAEPIAVTGDQTTVTISAVAVLDGRPNSAVVSETYTIDYSQTSTPQFSPPPGTVETDVNVEITSSTAGATIYYTTNGDEPDPDDTSGSTGVYSDPITVSGNGTSRTIRAIARAPGFSPSTIAEATYTVDYLQAPAPAFAPEPGDVYSDFDVVISTATAGASIYYTLNGDTPDPADLSGPTTLYTGPIPVAGDGTTITVKAVAGGSNFVASDVVEASYTITYPLVVTSSAPTGPGSINAVLASAADGSVVTFADGITTIVATETLPEGPAPTWSDLSKSVTIDGEDKGIVLDAAGFGRHFTIRNGNTLTLRNLTLKGGLGRKTDGTPTAGGSVYNYLAHLIVENVTFLDNVTTKSSSEGAAAGAVEVNAGNTAGAATAVFRNSTFENNAAGTHGGAINVINKGRVTIDNVTFRGNTAALVDSDIDEYGGGAVHTTTGSPAWILNSHFEDNGVVTAIRGVGGAIAIGGWMSVTDSTFVRNYAKLGGGAIYARRTSGLVLHGSYFHGNSAETNGGAVSSISDAVFDPNVKITSSVFVGNVTTGSGAGAIWLASTSHVSASSFAENVSESGEQDIYVSKGTGVTNSIIFNDSVRSGTWVRWSAGESDLSGYGSDNIQATIAVVQDPDPGDGTWGTVADDYGDLTPVPGSASIDAGSNALLLTDLWDLDGDGDGGETVPYDILGNPREVGTTVDMGAYERQSP
jgi:predicted outer membrane repeat protein